MQSTPQLKGSILVKTEMIPMPCQHKMKNGKAISGSAPFCQTIKITSGNDVLETHCVEIYHSNDGAIDMHKHETFLVGVALSGYRASSTDEASELFVMAQGEETEDELSENFDLVMSLNQSKSKYEGLREQDLLPSGSTPSGPRAETVDSEAFLEQAAGFSPESWDVSGQFEATESSSSPSLTFLPKEDRPKRREPRKEPSPQTSIESRLAALLETDMDADQTKSTSSRDKSEKSDKQNQ